MTRSLMQSSLLRAITRRHFFKQSGFGIGGLACPRCWTSGFSRRRWQVRSRQGRGIRGQTRTTFIHQGAALCAKGQEHHLSVHGRRSHAARPVRLQAGTAGARRTGDPARAHSQRGALRFHQRDPPAARITVHVQAIRTIRRGALRAAAASRRHRGRHRDRPVGAHDAVQPCARADLHEYREPGVRQAEHGLVAHVWSWKRQPRSPGLHRAALGRERARRRKVVLGQRIPSDGLPGRGIPIEERSRAVRVESARGRQRGAQGVDRSGDRPRPAASRRGRRSRDRYAHRVLRDGVQDAEQRAGADRHLRRPESIHALYGISPARCRSRTIACWPAV